VPPLIPKFPYTACSAIIVGIASVATAPASQSAEPSAVSDTNRVSNKTTAPAATALTEAEIEALLREIGLRRDSPRESAPSPETKASPSQPMAKPIDALTEALLKKMSVWYESRAEATPKPRPKPSWPRHSGSRRYWHHFYARYYDRSADRGEATRLMTDELRERGVAVDSSSRSEPGH
jgi:hypothetical protein